MKSTYQIVKALPSLPRRRPESHKGDFGRVLVIAGSRGMTGAAYLCAKGALRAGAGLVTVATPKSQQPILATKLTCSMTHPLPETSAGTIALAAKKDIIRLAREADAIALGPGLSQHPQTVKFVLSVLPFLSSLVIDADGLNALSKRINILKKAKAPIILTPHPGEMARLTGVKVQQSNPPAALLGEPHWDGEAGRSRVETAVGLAKKYKVIVVLKGYQTVVTDGRQVYINKTGNPGMATGGTGDILTGLIVGFLAQGTKPFPSAQLGVYLHGLAGDLAVREKGEISLIATDILDYVPMAIRCYMRKSRYYRMH